MGQFYKLKYFAGDLKQEIHYPIQEAREDVWKQNLSLTRLGLMAKEVDDFYHTIRMGELPHFTCLSCYQGSQRDCLLAAFDSNKNHSGLQRRERSSTGVSPADERLFPAAINAQF